MIHRFAQRAVLLLALFLGTLLAAAPAQACSSGACVSAGPRLASVSSARGALLNALLSTLGGGSISLSVLDWNAIAGGDVALARTVSALQATLALSTPQQALAANATVAQIVGAMANAAQQENRTTLATSLGALQAQLPLSGTVRLGNLISSDGVLGTTRINALSVVSGAVQLYNQRNVATTPTPITLSGSALGLAGVLNSVTLQAQVVEPPAYVCGPLGSSFHSAALRVKLQLDLVDIALDLGLPNTSASVGQLDLYLEIARADGALVAIDAIANTLSVQVAPGVAASHLGTIADAVFFDRTRALSSADVAPGTIGTLTQLGTTVAIMARSSAFGAAPSATMLSFSGPGLQTRTAYTSANFGANLFASLVDGLTLSLSPGGLLDGLLPALRPVLIAAVQPVLSTVLVGVVDPLLELMGIRLGEVDVTSGGTIMVCSVSGSVYRDANHSGRQDAGEAGTGVALYAKLIASASPTVASAVAAVDPATGAFSFANVPPASYTLVVATDASAASVAAAAPVGWVVTEVSTLTQALTIIDADVSGQRFGLYQGSRLQGRVFVDDGRGSGGIAHDGLRNGSEAAVPATLLQLTDASGATVIDSTRSDADGRYTLWAPFSTQGAMLKILQPADAAVWLSVSGRPGNSGGSYAVTSDTIAFTHASGSSLSGLDFGDVPLNRLETDGQRVIAAGTTAIFAHRFVAGSAGQAAFTASAPPGAADGWSAQLFVDTACDGTLDGADAPVTAAVGVAAGQSVCLLVKVFSPVTAPPGARYAVSIAAAFSYANVSIVRTLQRQDVATVAAGNGLRLHKSVDRSSAGTGELLVYTIAFFNDGSAPVDALRIRDATPPWTVYEAASCVDTPAGVVCAVTLQPAAGASGSLEWTLTGPLAGGASGSVQLRVRLQ